MTTKKKVSAKKAGPSVKAAKPAAAAVVDLSLEARVDTLERTLAVVQDSLNIEVTLGTGTAKWARKG